MSKYKITVKLFIFILFISVTLYAQSTYTVILPELSKEQIDWDNIVKLDSDSIVALKLAKDEPEFDYLRYKINRWQSVLELNQEKIAKNKVLGRGYFGHIYQCHIDSRIKQIEIEDETRRELP